MGELPDISEFSELIFQIPDPDFRIQPGVILGSAWGQHGAAWGQHGVSRGQPGVSKPSAWGQHC